jgi:hypothetical protein
MNNDRSCKKIKNNSYYFYYFLQRKQKDLKNQTMYKRKDIKNIHKKFNGWARRFIKQILFKDPFEQVSLLLTTEYIVIWSIVTQ